MFTPPEADRDSLPLSPMARHEPPDLEATLRNLEALHRQIGQQIAALRLLQEQHGLGIHGTFSPPEPYGKTPGQAAGDPTPYSLSVPAAQPDLLNPAKPSGMPADIHSKRSKPAKAKPVEPVLTLDEAKQAVLDCYILDHPGNADRLLKTLIFRLLDGSVKGFKSKDLPAARIVVRSMLEHAGIRSSGQGFNDGRLRSLMRRFLPFEPITSIRRLPR